MAAFLFRVMQNYRDSNGLGWRRQVLEAEIGRQRDTAAVTEWGRSVSPEWCNNDAGNSRRAEFGRSAPLPRDARKGVLARRSAYRRARRRPRESQRATGQRRSAGASAQRVAARASGVRQPLHRRGAAAEGAAAAVQPVHRRRHLRRPHRQFHLHHTRHAASRARRSFGDAVHQRRRPTTTAAN